jgi:hypothetical protein
MAMTDHVKALEQARIKLVDRRRALAQKGISTPDERSTFNDVQNTIEKIDKAIAEERKSALTGTTSEKFNQEIKYPKAGPP